MQIAVALTVCIVDSRTLRHRAHCPEIELRGDLRVARVGEDGGAQCPGERGADDQRAPREELEGDAHNSHVNYIACAACGGGLPCIERKPPTRTHPWDDPRIRPQCLP